MKISPSAVISRSSARRAPCKQVRGEKKRGAHAAFETGTPEKEMPPSPVPCAAPVTPPAPPAVPLTLRKSMQEMSAELQQLLEMPFPGTSLFYVLDKIARLSPPDSDGVTLDQLVENCAIAAEKSSPRLATRLAKATAGGHVLAREVTDCVRYQLTRVGRRYVDDGTQVRLKLWKVNPRMPLGQVCAIADLEEFREEVSQANVIHAREQRSHPVALPTVSRRRKAILSSPWAALLYAGARSGAGV